ncbi:MAG: 4-hydroxy-tetrahydrodipicolinate synthase [Clostridia bacterium]|nr:4-hydroxy-tetrahydrodipicolinate synthase [Clostridia bacterium]
MKKNTVFRGTATALITPFRDGKIDLRALGHIIEQQEAGGVSALVVAGTTGEAPTLTYSEHASLVGYAASRTSLPVIAGCGSNCTSHAVALAKSAHDSGASALLAVTPYYNKATADGIIAHYFAIADATPLPLMLYNVPTRTGFNLTPAMCAELAKHERIVAVKEASGNIASCAEIAALCGDSLALYSGNDDMILPLLSLGGEGVISVVSNIFPERVVALCRAYDEGRLSDATAIQCELMPVVKALFSYVNPVPVKSVMAARGMCTDEFRLPLCPLKPAELKKIMETVETLK